MKSEPLQSINSWQDKYIHTKPQESECGRDAEKQVVRTTEVKRGLRSDQVVWNLFPALKSREDLKRKEGCSFSGEGPGGRKTMEDGCAGRNMQTRRDGTGKR